MNQANRSKGKNLVYLRSSNQGEVVKVLLTKGRTSRQDLAERLSLTKMSITYIVNELIEKGVVRESSLAEVNDAPGRKPALLEVIPESVHAIGVYISRNHVITSVTSIAGNVVDSTIHRLSRDTTRYTLTELVIQQIYDITARHAGKWILGIGIACIGLVDTLGGVIVGTTDFFEIKDLGIREELARHFQAPIFVVNDMKAAAISESLYGVARGCSDFVYLGVTNGIGAGIIVNGKLFEGVKGFSSEIGHTTIYKDGRKCNCGNYGCLELYTSIPQLLRKSGHENWEALLSAAQQRDEKTCAVLDDFCGDMGAALISIVNIFDPQTIVIGHEGSMLGEEYYRKLQHIIDQRSMTRSVKRVLVLPSSLNETVKWIGGASMVFSKLFQGQLGLDRANAVG